MSKLTVETDYVGDQHSGPEAGWYLKWRGLDGRQFWFGPFNSEAEAKEHPLFRRAHDV